jgi:hypothetical protein
LANVSIDLSPYASLTGATYDKAFELDIMSTKIATGWFLPIPSFPLSLFSPFFPLFTLFTLFSPFFPLFPSSPSLILCFFPLPLVSQI